MSYPPTVLVTALPVQPIVKVVPVLGCKVVEVIRPVNEATVAAVLTVVEGLLANIQIAQIVGLQTQLDDKASVEALSTAEDDAFMNALLFG